MPTSSPASACGLPCCRKKMSATRRAGSEINEHDVVRVRHDVETEGYSLRAGMIGAVVSVYGNGSTFAVEFPDMDEGSAVVTVDRSQIDQAGIKNE